MFPRMYFWEFLFCLFKSLLGLGLGVLMMVMVHSSRVFYIEKTFCSSVPLAAIIAVTITVSMNRPVQNHPFEFICAKLCGFMCVPGQSLGEEPISVLLLSLVLAWGGDADRTSRDGAALFNSSWSQSWPITEKQSR